MAENQFEAPKPAERTEGGQERHERMIADTQRTGSQGGNDQNIFQLANTSNAFMMGTEALVRNADRFEPQQWATFAQNYLARSEQHASNLGDYIQGKQRELQVASTNEQFNPGTRRGA